MSATVLKEQMENLYPHLQVSKVSFFFYCASCSQFNYVRFQELTAKRHFYLPHNKILLSS